MHESPCNRNISHIYLIIGEMSICAIRIAVIELLAPFDIFVTYYTYIYVYAYMFPFHFSITSEFPGNVNIKARLCIISPQRDLSHYSESIAFERETRARHTNCLRSSGHSWGLIVASVIRSLTHNSILRACSTFSRVASSRLISHVVPIPSSLSTRSYVIVNESRFTQLLEYAKNWKRIVIDVSSRQKITLCNVVKNMTIKICYVYFPGKRGTLQFLFSRFCVKFYLKGSQFKFSKISRLFPKFWILIASFWSRLLNTQQASAESYATLRRLITFLQSLIF